MTEENSYRRPGNGWFANVVITLTLLFGALQLWKAYVRYDIGIKYDHAMKQCDKYGGVKGSIPIVTEGVYDHRSTAQQHNLFIRAAYFIKRGLKYVEFDSDVVDLPSSFFESKGPQFKGNSLFEFAYYRAYIATKGDVYCTPYERLLERGEEYYKDAMLSDNECVAVIGFDDPTLLKAPYELVRTTKTIDEGVPVNWSYIEIIDRKSNFVMASYNSFNHCFTKQLRHSQGFGYCSGSYGNSETNPTCPENYLESGKAVRSFEKSAFTYER